MNLVRTLSLPGAWRAARQWKPFSLSAFLLAKAMQRQGMQVRTVIDAGANAGQFSRAALEVFPNASLLAFEPQAEVAAQWRTHLDGEPRAELIEAALGATDGTLSFQTNAYSLSSSALPLHDNHLRAYPDAVAVGTVDVPMHRLDTILSERTLQAPILFKLDLQGYELEALRGAEATLTSVQYVLLESSFTPMYQGEPLFAEVYAFMQANGFRLVRPMGWMLGRADEVLQADVLFEREG
ncbi:MAG: hypothetical protein RhofKO_26860 [Rhodothermales bacterium]